MNRIYRVVFNRNRGLCQVACEWAAGAFLISSSGAALAADLPSGGQIVLGSGSISGSATDLVVDQGSSRLAIDWQSFDIGRDHSVTFSQPSAASIALNRVLGSDASSLLGRLNANGQVFLVNPNGIVFGRDAQVSVGGLVASTLDLSLQDFAAGHFRFSNTLGHLASVVNEGNIVAEGGGAVALLGGTVSNQGTIVANQGTIALASGDAIALDFAGDQLLSVRIDAATRGALVENHQLIEADGGKVILSARAADTVLRDVVNNQGIVRARGISQRNGEIVLLGGDHGVHVAGALDASSSDGDGGFIETSGRVVSFGDSASITTLAPRGRSGTWLIDPDGFTISRSGGDITGAMLTSALALGNVSILSTQGSGSDGAINVDDVVQWSANTLTLTATSNINVNNVMAASGTAGLIANYGTGVDASGVPYGVYMKQGLAGFEGRIDFTGTGGVVLNGTAHGVITNAAGFAAMAENGNYVLGTGLADSFVGRTIARFSGRLNGFGHTLVYANAFLNHGEPIGGLFGTLGDSAVVSNLGLRNGAGAIIGGVPVASAGSLANYNRGSIINSFSSVETAVDAETLGGLVGTNAGLIARSFFTGPVTVSGVGGALVGTNEQGGRILDSSARGPYSVEAKVIVTVIPGRTPQEDQYVVAAAPVTYMGGLVGINRGDIKRSWTSYYLETDDQARPGDIPGFMGGGFVGLNASTGTIDQSYAYRDTSASNLGTSDGARPSAELMDAVGGFVGENRGTITNAYAFDTLYRNAGASAGFAYRNSGSISSAYARYSNLGQRAVRAGFVRENTGSLSNVYWSYASKSDNTPEPGGAGGTQLSNDAAAVFSSYAGFDPSIWSAAGSGFPLLKNLAELYVGNSPGSAALQYGDELFGNQAGALWVFGLQAGDTRDRLQSLLAPTIRPEFLASGYLDVGRYNASRILDLGSSPYTMQGFFNISPRILTLSGTALASKDYDGTTTAFLADPLTGGFENLVGSQRLRYTYTASFDDPNAADFANGTLIYTSLSDGINGGKASNYAVPGVVRFTSRIRAREISLAELSAGALDKIYDGTTDASINLTTTDAVAQAEIAAGVLSLEHASAQFSDSNVGADKSITVSGLALSGSSARNYILAPTSLTDKADITPRPLDVLGSRSAPGGSSQVSASDLYLGNVVRGETVNLSGSATLGSTDAGSHAFGLGGFSIDNPNYTLSGGLGNYLIGDVRRGAMSSDAGITFNDALNPTVITVANDRAVINWQRFNIAAGETVQFIQPNASSVVLNRVRGSDPSVIAGTLSANGRVFILNPNGVLFAAGASVNAAALVASTLGLDDDDLGDDQRLVFKASASGAGSVVAEGDIVIVDGGFVALAGEEVRASGRVTARGGKALLTSVDRLTLNLSSGDSGLSSYTIGPLAGTTTVSGRVDVSAGGDAGGWIETAGQALAVNEPSLDTGSFGTWSLSVPNATIGTGGAYSGAFIGSQLAKRNLLLQAMSGDLAVNEDISWSSDAMLGLGSAGTIGINARVSSTGANGGLSLSGAYRINSARLDFNGNSIGRANAGISLSGANARLSIDGNSYTLLHSMADFARINSANGTGRYALAQNIDAAGGTYGGAVVSVFSGTFAGLGNTIDHLNIDAGLGANVGLIGQAGNGAVIRDIGVINANVRGRSDVGVLLGSGRGVVIDNAWSSGTITGTAENASANSGSNNLGGLVGQLDGSTLTNAHAEVAVTGGYSENGGKSSNTGGLVGFGKDSRISDAYATGDVTGSDYTGGLAGLLSSVATTNVWASGNVRGVPGNPVTPIDANTLAGAANVGGLAGSVEGILGRGSVINARASGNVSGGNNVGGLIGSTNAPVVVDRVSASGNVTDEVPPLAGVTPSNFGGLIGHNRGSVSNASATGNVTADFLSIEGIPTMMVGGLVGNNEGGTIVGSSASGTVYGGALVGGLVGRNSGGTISGSSATGNVTARATYAGGLVGLNDPQGSVIENSTATGDVTGWDFVGGLVGSNAGDIRGSTASGDVRSDPSWSRDGRTPGQNIGSLAGSQEGAGRTDATSRGSGTVSVITPDGGAGSQQDEAQVSYQTAVQNAQQMETSARTPPPPVGARSWRDSFQPLLNARARNANAGEDSDFSSSVRSIEVDGVIYQFNDPECEGDDCEKKQEGEAKQ